MAKLKLYYLVITPVVIYSCETWILKETIINPYPANVENMVSS
jgi:hypothetical protein